MSAKAAADHGAAPNALQMFHINVNCSDLGRSRAFYELIGFRVVNDFGASAGGRQPTFAEIGLAPMLRLPPDCDARAVLMALGDGARETRLDLIEWTRPKAKSAPQRDLATIGFGRLCLKVRSAWVVHDALAGAGHTVYTAPVLIEMGGTRQLCFCAEDPDGTVMEFMQFLRPGEAVGRP